MRSGNQQNLVKLTHAVVPSLAAFGVSNTRQRVQSIQNIKLDRRICWRWTPGPWNRHSGLSNNVGVFGVAVEDLHTTCCDERGVVKVEDSGVR